MENNEKQQKIEKLLAIGNRWQKYGKDRIYFPTKSLLKLLNVELDFYKTGNISDASMDGEHISNSEGRRILDALNDAKIYYDIKTDDFYRSFCPHVSKADKAIEKIKEWLED